jgi:DNA recombination protein RmuC
MQVLIAGAVAAFAGVFLGFWLRVISGKAEKSQMERRLQELTNEVNAVRVELGQAQAESATRAGFVSLAAEREKTIGQLSAEREGLRLELQTKTDAENRFAARISQLEAELKNERQNLQEKLALLESAKQALANQFEALAAEILEKKTKSFAEGSQKELGTLLNPLRDQIKEFRGKVEEAQKESLIGRTELRAQLEGLESLNRKLSDEAHNLATALRSDTKAQGNWGETILLNILENSGFLQKGIHFSFQQSFLEEAENGGAGKRRQTDVVVKLPEGRHLIIDSKVSINDYNDYIKSEDEEERKSALKRHLASVRKHYVELAERNYPRLPEIQSPDFVVMFIPVEPAFMLAIQEDDNIWLDAYQKGVLLAGPTTVLFVVRIVENLWRQEQQAKNVQKVMERGEKLYDKFVGFVDDLELVGNRISDAGQSYREAFSKLTSGRENLVRQVEMLRELGLKPKKKLKPKLLEAAGADEMELASGLALAAVAEENGEDAS